MWFDSKGCLLAGSNWNNTGNAGPGYLNANNTVSNANTNIGTHVELKPTLSSPEQQSDPNRLNKPVKQNAIHPGVSVLLGTLSRTGRAES